MNSMRPSSKWLVVGVIAALIAIVCGGILLVETTDDPGTAILIYFTCLTGAFAIPTLIGASIMRDTERRTGRFH